MEGKKNSSFKANSKEGQKGTKKQCFIKLWCTFGKKNSESKSETKSASNQSEKSPAAAEAKPVAITGDGDVKLAALAMNNHEGKELLDYHGAIHFFNDDNTEGCSVM